MNSVPAPRDMIKDFFSMLRDLKKLTKIKSNAELSELIGVSSSTVRSWFNGRKAAPTEATIVNVYVYLKARKKQFDELSAAIETATRIHI